MWARREIEALSDDRDVFKTLFERHGAALAAFLRGLGRDGHEAEDVFQDVAARAWKALRMNVKPKHERSWLLTIAYRAFLDHRAKNPEPREFREEEHYRSSTRLDRGDPVALAELAETKRLIDAAVAELSEPFARSSCCITPAAFRCEKPPKPWKSRSARSRAG